jgi:hypothetical protein
VDQHGAAVAEGAQDGLGLAASPDELRAPGDRDLPTFLIEELLRVGLAGKPALGQPLAGKGTAPRGPR